MLHALGVPLRTVGTDGRARPAGWDGKMRGFDIDVPGDLSAAAFLIVAAQIVAGSRVDRARRRHEPDAHRPARDRCAHMGAGLEVVPQGERGGEPVAEITAWQQPLRGARIGGELVPRAIDEIPIACALAARASGTTTIRDAEELRVKESDRIATMAGVLRAFGVACEELPDGLVIEGKPKARSSRRASRAAAITASR